MNRFFIGIVQALGNVHRRSLAAIFGILGPRHAYAISGWGARTIYKLLDPLRLRSEAQCRAAFPELSDSEIRRIAAESFVHRARNMTDLLLAPRLLNQGTYVKFGGQIDEPFRSELLAGQDGHTPTIFVTAYYGAFDLLPIFLGYNGIEAAAVYRPHENREFDKFRRSVRGQSGCELVPVRDAARRFNEILGARGMIAVLADHHDEERGMAVPFLGLQATATRSVGLLAWRHEANVVVAAIRRINETFQFQMIVQDVIYYDDVKNQTDAVEYVTQRYVQALERVIRDDPTQYLWAYARWGEAHADRVTQAHFRSGDRDEVRRKLESAVAGRVRDRQPEPEG